MSEAKDVPTGWTIAAIKDFATTATGGTPSRLRSDYFGGEVPWVKSGELGDGIVYDVDESLTQLGVDESNAKVFPKGTLCIALYGATVGKLGVLGMDATTNQAVCGIFLPDGIDTKYVFHFLASIRRELIEKGKGGAQSNISNGIVRETRVPLAPPNEQRRIVAKIEELFSDLEAGVAALTRARANLKRYRASVLKAAVEGALTAEWRTQHPQVEPASKLLARILTERRRQWAADQLAKYAAAGKQPPNNWQANYGEPAPPDTTNERNVDPFQCDNWRQLSEFITTLEQGWSPKCESEASDDHQEWTVMKTSAIQPLRFIDVENKRLPSTLSPRTEFELQPDDLLITRAGPRNRAGVTCLVRQTRPRVILCDKAYRVRFDEAVILAAYVEVALNAPTVLDLIDELKTGISDSGVNLTQKKFGDLRVPVPSLAEQAEIVATVSEKLSQIESAEVAIEHSLRRAARLRQSILKQAFEGKLVPQDPTDEPASTLLARIRAERKEHENPNDETQSAVRRRNTARSKG